MAIVSAAVAATANDLLLLKQQQLSASLGGIGGLSAPGLGATVNSTSPKRPLLGPTSSLPLHQGYAGLAPAPVSQQQLQQQSMILQQQQQVGVPGMSQASPAVSVGMQPLPISANSQQLPPPGRNLRNLPPQPPVIPPMGYYTQPPPQSYYGEILHPIQVSI